MKIYTAERTNEKSQTDNPILQRLLCAYNYAKSYVKGTTLEVGCGEGYGAKIFDGIADKYIGIDKYESKNKENFKNIEFIKMKVPYMRLFNDDTFDTIICFQVIEHIKRDDILLREIYRVLKPGGVCLLSTPNKKMSLTRNPYHVREYHMNELYERLILVFKDIDFKGVFGDELVMKYYYENKKSVERYTRYDIFRLQYILPRWILKLPYDIFNRLNRINLYKRNNNIVKDISINNYYIDFAKENCLDFLVILKK